MKRFTLFLTLIFTALMFAGCAGGGDPKTTETSLDQAATTSESKESNDSDDDDSKETSDISDPKALFEAKCSGCHGWDEPGLFVAEGKNASLKGQFLKHPKRVDWTDTVKRMRTNGMESTDEELEAIIKFLNDNWRA